MQLVAYGSIQPSTGVIHCSTKSAENCSVGIDSILDGYEDLALPFPIEEADIVVLSSTRGSYVQWPRAWVRLMDQVIKAQNLHLLMVLSYFSLINVIFICLCIDLQRKPKFNKEESGDAESEGCPLNFVEGNGARGKKK